VAALLAEEVTCARVEAQKASASPGKVADAGFEALGFEALGFEALGFDVRSAFSESEMLRRVT
jgi:hypothetical protein